MHVLIASDGSDLSVHAAQKGFSLLGKPERVTLLSVISAIPMTDAAGFDGVAYSPEAEQALWNAELEGAHAELTHTAQALTGTTIEKRAEVGDAASTICSVAAELGVDVIIVGSHGRTGVSRLFLGSTSEHVLRHAPCPVLVIREENPASPG
jgi:nucleotide-binding universal stress UspA family protein